MLIGGVVAGVVNTLAGGGSLLSVPLLVLLGLPGTLANATNRVGVLLQNGVAAWGFQAQGVSGLRGSLPLLIPSALGAAVGATVVSQLPDDVFERLFGVLMLVLLVPTLRKTGTQQQTESRDRPAWIQGLVFFGIGLYGGAFQAGVGLLMVFALSISGVDLVRANSIKVVIMFCFTAAAIPIFVLANQIVWPFAIVLGIGFAVGGALGSRIAVRGGERVIRPVLAVAVVALAGKMFGLY